MFRVSIPWVQTGTILSCICCMWDNIPCALLRILSWCAAKEIPILPMSLFERNTRQRWWKRPFNLLQANRTFFFPLSSFASYTKSKNSILAEHLHGKVGKCFTEIYRGFARNCDYRSHMSGPHIPGCWFKSCLSFSCINQKHTGSPPCPIYTHQTLPNALKSAQHLVTWLTLVSSGQRPPESCSLRRWSCLCNAPCWWPAASRRLIPRWMWILGCWAPGGWCWV